MRVSLLLVLGNKNLSSWSLRPWLLLRHAGIAFEERVFLFEDPGWRDEIVKLSPSRRVPALRHDSEVIWDSLAICEYINDLHPEKNLWPKDPKTRAIARSVSAEMHSSFGNLRKDLSMDVTARIPRRATRSAETQADIDRIVQIWTDCRQRFGGSWTDEPFLFGPFSIADAMYAPVVWRFRSYDIPIKNELARWWYEMMLTLPAMKEWEADAEKEVAELAARPKEKTPDPKSAQHCFAVIFSSQHKPGAQEAGYDDVVNAMEELAKKQPGFLGIEGARSPDGFGITVSYWDSLEAISAWKAQADHQRAQSKGRESFYSRYEVRVCSVERGYKFPYSQS
jgi:glutathione S-transferase